MRGAFVLVLRLLSQVTCEVGHSGISAGTRPWTGGRFIALAEFGDGRVETGRKIDLMRG